MKRRQTELAKIAGIDVETFAKEMFNAGSNLKNKTVEEIFLSGFQESLPRTA